MLLHYLGKLNIQIFCRYERKRKKLHFWLPLIDCEYFFFLSLLFYFTKQRDITSSTRWRCNQPALFRATKCFHTTTGSCQSHPHFIEETSYAFVCLNISIFCKYTKQYIHKYTHHTVTRIEELKSVHSKCNLFALSSVSAEYLPKKWMFNFPR